MTRDLIYGVVIVGSLTLILWTCWQNTKDTSNERIFQAQQLLKRTSHCRVTSEQAMIWLAMKNAYENGYWAVEERKTR